MFLSTEPNRKFELQDAYEALLLPSETILSG
jgi:hypothetical protein